MDLERISLQVSLDPVGYELDYWVALVIDSIEQEPALIEKVRRTVYLRAELNYLLDKYYIAVLEGIAESLPTTDASSEPSRT